MTPKSLCSPKFSDVLFKTFFPLTSKMSFQSYDTESDSLVEATFSQSQSYVDAKGLHPFIMFGVGARSSVHASTRRL